MKIFSSVKNMKATADAWKRRSSFRARVRRNAHFATVSSCTRRFFKHINFKFWRMIRYSLPKWRIHVSRKILCVVLWLFGAPSWLKINLLTESTLSTVRALRGRPLPWRLLVLPVFLNFLYNLFRPEIAQLLPGKSPTSFYHYNFCYKNVQLKRYPQHRTSYLYFKRRLL